MSRPCRSLLKDQRGILTLDFIFAMILGMGFTVVFFALTLTLSLVEVTQYLSFSVARVSLAAHESRADQIALGNLKYNELRAKPVFRTLFSQGWFTLPAQPSFGNDPNNRGFNDEYPADPIEDNETFIGARIRIRANVIRWNSPFLGSTTSDSQTGVADVQTFLGREVTTSECREKFNRERWTRIMTLGGGAYSQAANVAGNVALITDNGC